MTGTPWISTATPERGDQRRHDRQHHARRHRRHITAAPPRHLAATVNKTTAGDVVEVTGRTGSTVFNFNIIDQQRQLDLTGSSGGTIGSTAA